jgi:cysteine desulfurase
LITHDKLCKVNAGSAARIGNTSSVVFDGVEADLLLTNLPELCLGKASACSSGSYGPSSVLLASGLTHEEASCTLRFSFGRYVTQECARACARLVAERHSKLLTSTGALCNA